MTDRRQQQARRQHGFTLLEVLIALLVLSIGLLGLAALQTTGMRSNQMASMRTLVTQLAYDMSDRMRANPTGVENNEYVIARTTDEEVAPDTVAKTDITQWRSAIERLPGGQSSIVQCDPGTLPACAELAHVITIYWNESRADNVNSYNCPPLTAADHRCYQLVF